MLRKIAQYIFTTGVFFRINTFVRVINRRRRVECVRAGRAGGVGLEAFVQGGSASNYLREAGREGAETKLGNLFQPRPARERGHEEMAGPSRPRRGFPHLPDILFYHGSSCLF